MQRGVLTFNGLYSWTVWTHGAPAVGAAHTRFVAAADLATVQRLNVVAASRRACRLPPRRSVVVKMELDPGEDLPCCVCDQLVCNDITFSVRVQ